MMPIIFLVSTASMFQQTRANPFLDDMMLAHEASPEEIDADWARHARRGMGSLPDG